MTDSSRDIARDDTLDRARDLTLVPVFAGVIAALGVVPAIYAIPGVPITAQSLGVMLAGAVLGARRGGLALLLFIALVAVGFPLLSGGRGGLGVFVSPTAGFVIGFPVAAYATGWITERLGAPYRLGRGIAANVIGGVALLYAFGVPGYVILGDTPLRETIALFAVFVPGDIVKAVLAAFVARGVHQAYPGLIPRREATASSAASGSARREKGPKDPARG